MIGAMFQRLIRRRSSAPDHDTWRSVAAGFEFLDHLGAAELDRLRSMCGQFLARKQISGAAGFATDETVRLSIAIQACLPILHLDLAAYDGFVEIVVYPARFLVPREQVDDAGVVHQSVEELSGEAMDGGPVVLSWEDTAAEGLDAGMSVVIHEFVHKLDLLDGLADGIPPLPRGRRRRWREVLEASYQWFVAELDELESLIPDTVDPESPAADHWYRQLPLDPYAATDHAEFFAVAAETFFLEPEILADALPEFYAELALFFHQDPLAAAKGP